MAGHSKWASIQHRRGRSNRPCANTGSPGNPARREVIYEGYGPGGTAVMVACVTGSRDRKLAELRSVFARHGGHLGAAGSVAYLFNEVGLLSFPPGQRQDQIMAAALEAGAEDVIAQGDGAVDVLTDPLEFAQVTAALERAGLRPGTAGITRRSSVSATLGEHDAAAMLTLLGALENLDDVQDVYSNADIPPDVLARLSEPLNPPSGLA